jgi:hypothetical protein
MRRPVFVKTGAAADSTLFNVLPPFRLASIRTVNEPLGVPCLLRFFGKVGAAI